MIAAVSFVPVILCGGAGTRLWPLSRSGFPKQFLCLTGDESLFQQAVRRMMAVGQQDCVRRETLVVCSEDHRFLAQEQLREVGHLTGSRLILEPMGKNTAPAMTLAALAALETGEDPVLAVVPADQTVADAGAFAQAMRQAVLAAADGHLVTLGVRPDRPETGYGYIRAAAPAGAPLRPVEAFVEKPDAATAAAYLADGRYYWNAGMFVVRASVWLAALERFRPEMAAHGRAAWAAHTCDGDFLRPQKAHFGAISGESVDYAVMEHCPDSGFSLGMVPLDAGWSDLGAWDALWQVLPHDALGNALRGDVLAVDSSDNLVHASGRLVALVGVRDLVVVETADALLVAQRSQSQAVKQVVETLAQAGRVEHTLHRKVQRPWGWYDGIDEGERFKVKRIGVKPKASLSLQMHHHRAEHWVVVKGTAEVTCGEKKILLSENQSTYIPLGETHRLHNPGTIALEIIEVQSGSYLGEDDIVRFDDQYGRKDQ